LLSKIQNIMYMILIIAAFITGYLLHKPANQIITSVEYRDVDTTRIVQTARHGYIKYDRKALIKEFGSIYKDTNIVYIDSLKIKDSLNIIDSISVDFMEADTTFSFSKEDSAMKLDMKFLLNQKAYWYPLYIFDNKITLKEFNFKMKQPEFIKPKWYMNKEAWALFGFGLGFIIGNK